MDAPDESLTVPRIVPVDWAATGIAAKMSTATTAMIRLIDSSTAPPKYPATDPKKIPTSDDTDTTAIADLSLGDGVRLDAVMSAVPTLQLAIKQNKPIKLLGGPLFFEPLAVAIDKSSTLDPTSLVQRVSQIIQQMHQDGTLSQLSRNWYGEELTVAS